jgi:hypothetical protein
VLGGGAERGTFGKNDYLAALTLCNGQTTSEEPVPSLPASLHRAEMARGDNGQIRGARYEVRLFSCELSARG